jgi:carbamoyltransferase
MHILSLQLGHNATVGLYDTEKGEFLEVVSQEKFDNIKNSSVFPIDAINYVISKYKLNQVDLKIIIAGKYVYPNQIVESINTENSQQSKIRILYRYLELKTNWKIFDLINEYRMKKFARKGYDELIKKLKSLGFNTDNIYMVEHHNCHTYSPIALYGDNNKEWLIFTMDGMGDGTFASISIYRNGNIEKIVECHQKYSIGLIYSNTTKFLGMKVLEHEYKVMGLAAYAKEKYFMKTYEKIFKDIIWIDKNSLQFYGRFPVYRFDLYLKEKALYERFDNIAGALQYFTEKLVLEWIKEAIKKTGIKNIMISGGVFMNVKLNQKIMELDEAEEVFFMPSCGDESNVFGATAYFVKNELKQKMKRQFSIYLGMEYSNEEIKKFIQEKKLGEKYRVQYIPEIERKIAELLSQFKVVARFAGRTEFGARSLGNRAILANPSDMKSFYMVNDQIKARDFWMPFAPSVLDRYAGIYFKNFDLNKNMPYYMIVTYDTTNEFQEKCRAAMHQGDKTARPQIVTKEINLKYYKILEEFEKLTGIGAVLNTSLNIHGYPLVGILEQALFTFENSGLKYMALENWLISKE